MGRTHEQRRQKASSDMYSRRGRHCNQPMPGTNPTTNKE